MIKKIILSKTFHYIATHACITAICFYAPLSNAAICEHTIQTQWDSGFAANISITNDQDTVIENWTLNWAYDDATVTSVWSAQLSGDNPYSASDLGWNQYIYPGQTIVFGLIAQKTMRGNTTSNVVVTGDVCNPTPVPTPTPSPPTGPFICADSWQDLSISGLDNNDKIYISWNAQWMGEYVGLIGNQEFNSHHFGLCGPRNTFPPLELFIIDESGYDCDLASTSAISHTIECSKLVEPSPQHNRPPVLNHISTSKITTLSSSNTTPTRESTSAPSSILSIKSTATPITAPITTP